MSQERARALEARGQAKKAALQPELDAAVAAAGEAGQLHEQAQAALAQAQQAHDAAAAALRTRQETVDALQLQGAALDGAIRAANNAGDIYGAIEQLRAGEVAAEVIAPIEKQALDLEAQALAVIGPGIEVIPAPADPPAAPDTLTTETGTGAGEYQPVHHEAESTAPLRGEDGQPLAPPPGDLAADLASPQPIAPGDGQ